VGMPRSGTSLAASIFAKQGYFVVEDAGVELERPDINNRTGYWEARHLIEANVEVLRAVGYADHNTWLFSPISDAQRDAILKLEPAPEHRKFFEKYCARQPWMWKDPRLCYTLAYWWPLISSQFSKVLLVRRDPEEIWNSFTKLGWRSNDERSRQDVMTRIDHHMAAAEAAIRLHGIPCEELHYSEYRARPLAVANRINKAFGLRLQASDLGYRKALNSSSPAGKLRVGARQLSSRAWHKLPAGLRSKIKATLNKVAQRRQSRQQS